MNLRSYEMLFFMKKRSQKLRPYADNTFLPFALLAARTFLPPAVAILALNP